MHHIYAKILASLGCEDTGLDGAVARTMNAVSEILSAAVVCPRQYMTQGYAFLLS